MVGWDRSSLWQMRKALAVAFGSDPFDRFGASLQGANTDGIAPDELVVGAPEAGGATISEFSRRRATQCSTSIRKIGAEP